MMMSIVLFSPELLVFSFIYLFIWLCWALVVAYGNQFPDQESNPGPLHWELRVLATGPLGKSPSCCISFFFVVYISLLDMILISYDLWILISYNLQTSYLVIHVLTCPRYSLFNRKPQIRYNQINFLFFFLLYDLCL